MYDIRAIYEPADVRDAVRLLTEHPGAKIIAGGSDVLIQIREGKLAGCELVSIYGLDELRGVSMDDDGTLRIGSLTSFRRITEDPLIRRHIPVLGAAVDLVGGPQIRAIGTIGGNTCNGVTSADSASTLTAWDARIQIDGPEGRRVIPILDFYLGPGKTDLRPGELQTAILIPRSSYEGYRGHYIKYGMRRAMEIATIGCSVNVKLSRDRTVLQDLRIGFGVAGPVPGRAPLTEERFRGAPLSDTLAGEIARSVLEDVHPRDSWRAAKDFREHICSELARRAFLAAAGLPGPEDASAAEPLTWDSLTAALRQEAEQSAAADKAGTEQFPFAPSSGERRGADE